MKYIRWVQLNKAERWPTIGIKAKITWEFRRWNIGEWCESGEIPAFRQGRSKWSTDGIHIERQFHKVDGVYVQGTIQKINLMAFTGAGI